MYLSTYLPIYLSIYLSIYLPIYLCIYLCIYRSIYPSIYLSIHPSNPSIHLSVCLSTYLSICNLENEAILRDVLNSWTWQHQNRSNSARRPQLFALDTVKNETVLRDSLQKWKVKWRADGLVPMRLAVFFRSTCLKYCACLEKVMPGHTKCCTCHAKSSQQTWRSDAPKCNTSQEISARTS